MISARRIVALLVGALLFCYPGFVIVSEWIGVRRRFPQNASSLWSTVLVVALLYCAIVAGVALRFAGGRRPRGWDAFRGGVRGATVLFVLGFFGPFVWAWLTQTEVGNIILALGAGLIVFGLGGQGDA